MNRGQPAPAPTPLAVPRAGNVATPAPAPAPVGSPTPAAATRSALVLAFAAIYLIWGSTYLGIRVAVQTMPPFAMAGARFIIAGTALFGILRWRGAPLPTWRQWRINIFIGMFLLLGGNSLVAWAEQYLPSGLTALLIGVEPLFIVLTEWAWPGGSRPGAVTCGALLLGFGGVAWLAAPWEGAGVQHVNMGGLAAVLLACVLWAYGSIYSRHAKHGMEPLQAAAPQMVGGGATILVAAWWHGDFAHLHVSAISSTAWWAFAYLVLMGSLVGFSTYVWLIKHAMPARVSTYAFVNPVVAVFLGWLILGEAITQRTIVAAVVIVTAVVIITMQKNRASKRGT